MIPLASHLPSDRPDTLTRWIGPPARPLPPDDPRRLPVGDLFDATGSILVRHLPLFVAAVGLSVVPSTLVGAALAALLGGRLAAIGPRPPTEGDAVVVISASVGLLVVLALGGIVAAAAATAAARPIYEGAPAPSVPAVYRRVIRRLPGILGLALLYMLGFVVALVGLALLLVALLGGFDTGEPPSGIGVFLALVASLSWLLGVTLLASRVSLAGSSLVLEDASPIDSLGRSWQLTGGSTLRVTGVLIAGALVSLSLSGIIPSFSDPFVDPFAPEAPLSLADLGTTLALEILTGGLAQLVLGPLAAIVTTILFLDLRRWHATRIRRPEDPEPTAAQPAGS